MRYICDEEVCVQSEIFTKKTYSSVPLQLTWFKMNYKLYPCIFCEKLSVGVNFRDSPELVCFVISKAVGIFTLLIYNHINTVITSCVPLISILPLNLPN